MTGGQNVVPQTRAEKKKRNSNQGGIPIYFSTWWFHSPSGKNMLLKNGFIFPKENRGEHEKKTIWKTYLIPPPSEEPNMAMRKQKKPINFCCHFCWSPWLISGHVKIRIYQLSAWRHLRVVRVGLQQTTRSSHLIKFKNSTYIIDHHIKPYHIYKSYKLSPPPPPPPS